MNSHWDASCARDVFGCIVPFPIALFLRCEILWETMAYVEKERVLFQRYLAAGLSFGIRQDFCIAARVALKGAVIMHEWS